ncbi:MAG: hypothetical protein OXE79_10550 [Acidimicrobiaceae bacterium]|nr:hypothetical protein [Acidimicrobiaceae bacterium]MCY4175538.1 hypothetical protein [Acidimicrobiaceae bacterium]MCY4280116.1 hypothetical protein [Acidimicrobiaceae bacterium]MCY4293893.1 hypothetical protein [Acidimicrobiaceae bacterium]
MSKIIPAHVRPPDEVGDIARDCLCRRRRRDRAEQPVLGIGAATGGAGA